MKPLPVTLTVCAFLWLCTTQGAAANDSTNANTIRAEVQTAQESMSNPAGASVLLGAYDVVTLATPDIQELDRRAVVIDSNGQADVPLVGRVKASGLTPSEFASQVQQRLRKLYLKPQVSIASVELKSRPISVLGAVNTPGVQQADGHKRLLEVLSSAGGLRQDAGPEIEVSRREEIGGLPKALSPSSKDGFETVSVSVADLFEAKRPEDNFAIQAGDVVTVPKARMVYVVGDVRKGGGFVVGERDNLSVLKALALAEGVQSTADTAHARILRAGDNSAGRPFNVAQLLRGKAPDTALKPDDILFIPSSVPKKAAIRVLEAAIQTGTGIAIWR
jgi:polysaccharide export outer membrane protein